MEATNSLRADKLRVSKKAGIKINTHVSSNKIIGEIIIYTFINLTTESQMICFRIHSFIC